MLEKLTNNQLMLATKILKKYLPDEFSMAAMGKLLAKAMANHGAGALIFLQGELGAGKTTLVRGFLQGLGYLGRVKSPTYTLVESYQVGDVSVYHFDFYRINAQEELEFIGLNDYFSEGAICLVEWPELAQGWLPAPDLVLHIAVPDEGRNLEVEAVSKFGQQIMEHLRHAAKAL